MGTPDSREYDRLKERGFKPYSKGHREMYEKAIRDMNTWGGYGNPPPSPLKHPAGARVLEAGFGIGWGLDRMLHESVLRSYVGYEPNKDSFDYVKGRYLPGGPVDLLFLNLPFEPNLDPAFDVAFCIEVIEHVPMDKHEAFLAGLRQMAPVLYFSTPDSHKVPREGVRTMDQWLAMLLRVGYDSRKLHFDDSEWTTFYRCER